MNIGQTLGEIAHQRGQATALIEASTGRVVTFFELNRLADSYSHYLTERGVHSGDRVMLMVKPSADFIALTFALFKIGAPVILIDPGMGYKNLLRCIHRVHPKVLLGIPKALLFSKIFYKIFSTVTLSFCCGKSFGLFGRDLYTDGAHGTETFPAYVPQQDDLAAIIFTTGSTGAPKGVRYEHDIFAAQREHIKQYYGIGINDIDQPAFPLFALFSTSLGACAVIPDMDPTKPAHVDPEKFIRSIQKNKVTYSFGSPAIWNVVSRYCVQQGIILYSLQKVLMAGAPISGELLQRMKKILPDESEVYTPYGATESLPIVSMTGSEILASTWSLTRRGNGTCVGRPLPGIQIRIIQISDNVLEEIREAKMLPPGEIGEIIVSGNVVTRSYDNNEEETNLAKIRDGQGGNFWHRMGDAGYLDAEGRLWFCGRQAHRVTASWGTMFTIPCEAIINEHPDVFRSALVGIESDGKQGIQTPVMIVEKNSEAIISDKDLLDQVKKLGQESGLTANIYHFLVHPSFPVDIRHNAKIFREKLAVWAQSKI